jgi:hypothetical protein
MARAAPYGECMRCGFKYRLPQLRKEWTGLRVCGPCFDPKPPELKPPKYKPEGLPKPNASPETPIREGRASKDDL